MEFEWDDIKNQENIRKHGVSFHQAELIWEGIHFEIENLARSDDEETRNATMGWIGSRVYLAIWTSRGQKIRLISVRRAGKNEEKIFLEKIQN